MTVAIACTWKPYGDEQRLQAVAARLEALGVQLCVRSMYWPLRLPLCTVEICRKRSRSDKHC
jgi:hypothetical protein